MSAHENNMSVLINMSTRSVTARGYSLTTRANKTALCPAGCGDSPRVTIVSRATSEVLGARLACLPCRHRQVRQANLKELGYGMMSNRVDVREEYVVFLQLDAKVAARRKEVGYGG